MKYLYFEVKSDIYKGLLPLYLYSPKTENNPKIFQLVKNQPRNTQTVVYLHKKKSIQQ